MSGTGASFTVSGTNNDTKIIVDSEYSSISADPETHDTSNVDTPLTGSEIQLALWVDASANFQESLAKLLTPVFSDPSNVIAAGSLVGYVDGIPDASNAMSLGMIFETVIYPVKEDFFKALEPASQLYGKLNIMPTLVKMMVGIFSNDISTGLVNTGGAFATTTANGPVSVNDTVALIFLMFNMMELIADPTMFNYFWDEFITMIFANAGLPLSLTKPKASEVFEELKSGFSAWAAAAASAIPGQVSALATANGLDPTALVELFQQVVLIAPFLKSATM